MGRRMRDMDEEARLTVGTPRDLYAKNAVMFLTVAVGMAYFGLGNDPVSVAVAWVCVVVAGAFACYMAYAAVVLRGDVVTVSEDGFKDLRLSKETVPWSAVAGVREVSHRGYPYLHLSLRDGYAPRRRVLLGNRLGPGMYVSGRGLACGFGVIVRVATVRHLSYEARAAAR